MATRLAAIIAETDGARRALNAVSGTQLHSQKQRDRLKAIVEQYFNEHRAQLTQLGPHPQLHSVDENMQLLLTLCHRRGSVSQYKKILADLKRDLIVLDSALLSLASAPKSMQALDKSDGRIIETLRLLVPSAALAYQQAMLDLAGNDRLSWRGPATDLRECLREALDHLAPDSEVTAMPGFRQEPNTNGPTMKQKVRFILKRRDAPRSASGTAEAATDAVDEALGTFVRSVYTRSSVSTHTPTDRQEVSRVADLVKVVLKEILEVRDAH